MVGTRDNNPNNPRRAHGLCLNCPNLNEDGQETIEEGCIIDVLSVMCTCILIALKNTTEKKV